jgi:hypothetical protein
MVYDQNYHNCFTFTLALEFRVGSSRRFFGISGKKLEWSPYGDHRFEVSSTLHQKLLLYEFVYAPKIVL